MSIDSRLSRLEGAFRPQAPTEKQTRREPTQADIDSWQERFFALSGTYAPVEMLRRGCLAIDPEAWFAFIQDQQKSARERRL